MLCSPTKMSLFHKMKVKPLLETSTVAAVTDASMLSVEAFAGTILKSGDTTTGKDCMGRFLRAIVTGVKHDDHIMHSLLSQAELLLPIVSCESERNLSLVRECLLAIVGEWSDPRTVTVQVQDDGPVLTRLMRCPAGLSILRGAASFLDSKKEAVAIVEKIEKHVETLPVHKEPSAEALKKAQVFLQELNGKKKWKQESLVEAKLTEFAARVQDAQQQFRCVLQRKIHRVIETYRANLDGAMQASGWESLMEGAQTLQDNILGAGILLAEEEKALSQLVQIVPDFIQVLRWFSANGGHDSLSPTTGAIESRAVLQRL